MLWSMQLEQIDLPFANIFHNHQLQEYNLYNYCNDKRLEWPQWSPRDTWDASKQDYLFSGDYTPSAYATQFTTNVEESSVQS